MKPAYTNHLGLRISKELSKRLQQEALRRHLDVSDIVRLTLLREFDMLPDYVTEPPNGQRPRKG